MSTKHANLQSYLSRRRQVPRRTLLVCLALYFCIPAGCSSSGSKARPISRADFVGQWRIVFDSPGGALPINIEIFSEDKPGPDQAPAVYRNGDHVAPFSELSISGSRINLRVLHRDAAITARLDESRQKFVGTWQVTDHDGSASLPIVGYKGQSQRFESSIDGPAGATDAVPKVVGPWQLTFGKEGGMSGTVELSRKGGQVTGTIIYPEGSVRYLTGRYDKGVLRLSSFNGGVVTLLRLRARDDGTLSGGIWYNDDGFFSLTARSGKTTDAMVNLPDPYSLVKVVSEDKKLEFEYADTSGKKLSIESPRFEGKVVLVELFGTWCSNCNDAAPHLVGWYQRFRKRGFDMVGLAFEHTGNLERDRRQVDVHKEHYKVPYPLLLAGTSDLSRPLEALSDISMYPTLVFLGRDGTVRKIHSGFLGPSAGELYTKQIAQLEADLEELLNE